MTVLESCFFSVSKDIRIDEFDDKEKGYIQMIQWSPDFHHLVFVANNNLFYMKDGFNPEIYQKLTENGVKEVIFNGIADHLYEGENIDLRIYLMIEPYYNYIVNHTRTLKILK